MPALRRAFACWEGKPELILRPVPSHLVGVVVPRLDMGDATRRGENGGTKKRRQPLVESPACLSR